MQHADALMGVIDRLYAAATEPEQWRPALDAITDLLDAGHTILTAGGGAAPGFMLAAGVDEAHLARLVAARREGMLARLDISHRPAGSIVMRRAIVPDDEFLNSDYYNDVIRPLNGFNSAFTRQERSHCNFSLTVCRPQGVEDFSAADVMRLRGLLPHLGNAVELHHRLRAAEQHTSNLARLLDRVDAGVILVDAGARVLFTNACAEQLLDARDGLTVGAAGLTAGSAAATRRLRDAIRVLATPEDARGQNARLRVERPSLRAPLLLTLVPVWRLELDLSGAPAPRVAIFINEPGAPIRIDRAAVAEAFRLTGRETEIAALIGEGQDLNSIAATLTLSVATVRNHLKRVFDKTGTHSQAALVSLVRGLAEPRR